MSSSDEIHDEFEGSGMGSGGNDEKNKKRRIQRACDTCRRKKIRCDGSQMVDNRCTNCITWNMECTYIEAAKKRGPPKGYVESLENRLEKMEKLLRSLCPDADFTKELGTFIDRETWYHERSSNKHGMGSSTEQNLPKREVPPVGGMRAASYTKASTMADDDIPLSDEEVVHMTLAEGLKDISLNVHDRRFHGKSSGIMLVQAAMDFKREYSGGEDVIGSSIPDNRRAEFWAAPDWENTCFADVETPLDFPPNDLVLALFDLFFQYMNPFYPIHHRPSLEKSYEEGLHHANKPFAATLLLTCAVASRWSDDPRVFVEESKHSAGWGLFERAQALRRNTLAPPSLYDIQVYALSALFLSGSSAPQAAWTMIGIGIRLAQDVGAHRRKVYNASTTIEDEQWKRAFWTLVALDRGTSSALGRPCAIQDEDFDLDHPLEVDDEYWDLGDASMRFKQPSDRPPRVSFFNCFLKLNQILAFGLRTIYSINKSKILLGFVGPQWEQHIVAELDSALNKWIDSVPDHLRWDPNREDPLFFSQSATLYATYYHLQILIHRPFIPTPRKPSPLSFPSLAICTNAARSCSHVLDIARRRWAKPMPITMAAAFTSGIVLLLNIWGAKKSGMQSDPLKQMQDVHKCMQHLKDVETRFRAAGRLWDILYELASVGELPLPQPSPPGNSAHKRERDSDVPIASSHTSTPSHSATPLLSAPRPIAKSRASATSRSGSGGSACPSISNSTPTPPLPAPQSVFNTMQHPVTSVDLGRMPLHPEMQYGNTQDPLSTLNWTYGLSQATHLSESTFASSSSQQHQHQPQQSGYGEQLAHNSMYSIYTGQPSAQPMSYATESYTPQQQQAAMTMSSVPTQQGTYVTPEQQQGQSGPEVEFMGGMWSNAPASFEYDDWGNWVSSGIDPATGLMAGAPPDHNMQHHGHGHQQ